MDSADAPLTGARLGLALSGGGFRAAFFHIGVLARMASLGLLRHVQVISTVSGAGPRPGHQRHHAQHRSQLVLYRQPHG